MERRTRVANMRKRRRCSMGSEAIEAEERGTMPKRSYTRRTENSGLLTPEPSSLADMQTTDDVLPEHTFPFMKLPAELRIHVYHMALQRDESLLLHAHRAPEKTDEERAAPERTTPERVTPERVTPERVTTARGAAGRHGSSVFSAHRVTALSRPDRRLRTPSPEHTPLRDPIVPEILRLNKQVYKEARQVLYSDNVFTLNLTSGIYTLSTLHQRSRSLIKHVVLTIPSHHDILDGFADLVRLGLRYCWGLKTFRIILQASLPDDGRVSGTTSVYANAFHILRWLPRGCSVVLEGNVSETVKRVVTEEGRLQTVLDETSYLKRQHQMPERH